MSPDLRETISYFLPVLWAAVAAGVALLLYKTSKSFLDGLDMPGLPLKGLRIAGSVVIFVVVFLLLKVATPSSSGTTIAEADLSQLRSTAE
jgi:phosphoglycerol transferase MdoB-like AlkP superfamily enzyme